MNLFRRGDPAVSRAIGDYLEIVSQDSSLPDAEILEAMMKRGNERDLSWQVIGLIPCLASREKLAGLGIEFSEEYIEFGPDSVARKSGKLKKHPIWSTALGLKRKIMDCAAIDQMVLRSAEFTAINDALNAGSDPKTLQTSPITMMVTE